jgi:hypothetical protein
MPPGTRLWLPATIFKPVPDIGRSLAVTLAGLTTERIPRPSGETTAMFAPCLLGCRGII